MIITTELVKKTIKKLGFKWYSDRPNLIGIRSTMDVPDAFNDFFVLSQSIPEMPEGLSVIKQQAWLNSWGFVGKNGKPLLEDGDAGGNTIFALEQFKLSKGKESIKIYPITTNPGVYWLKNFNAREVMGTAILKCGQWENCWSLGYHQESRKGKTHKALVQTGDVIVYRDTNRDDKYQLNEKNVQKGKFGINIHGSNKSGPSTSIGQWSAGCQVFSNWANKEEVMGILEKFRTITGNKFTYTLVDEKDLV